ncbi:MAG: HDIG domain-containing protein [Chloroflexota bacterium]|nr:MAG: HDIG domain-containing protein [Chloroflexota bacterium]
MKQDQFGGHIEGRSQYAGRWIAYINGKIVGHGGTPQQAVHAAKASRFKETPQVSFVPTSIPITVHPIVNKISSQLPKELPIYLVGGAVRDALLNLQVVDLDFLLQKDAIQTARTIADSWDGDFYGLDKKRDYGRVLLTETGGKRLVLDFTPIQGSSLEEDLKNRDFTINAMALEIHHPTEILDPLGGAADLHTKRLKPCSSKSFTADPLRILRGIRFSINYNLSIDPGTRELMHAAVNLLPTVSAERLRDELLHLLASDKPAAAFRILDQLNALPEFRPELLAMKGVPQPPPHIHDVWDHSLDVLTKLHQVINVLQPVYNPDESASLFSGVISHRLGRFRERIREHLESNLVATRELKGLIFLGALYHDIGKPLTKQFDIKGQLRFFNHDEIGAEITGKMAAELQFSSAEVARVKTIVLHHMRPLLLAQTGKLPTRRAIYRFFRDTGPAGVDICLLSLADTLATYGPTLNPEIWAHQVEVVRSLLEAWWENKEEVISPVPLIDGNDLLDELGLQPGPIIGNLLREIREAQASGKVFNRRQALELASEILNDPSGRWQGNS